MSRFYNMTVKITGAASDRIDAVKQAAEAEWPFDGWSFNAAIAQLTASADDRLCGGETEDEFAQRLAKAIWTANGDYCQVDVHATYLEDLPCDTHSFDQDQYDAFLSATDKSPKIQEDHNHG
ncbi:MAG: hypothetical protein HQ581_07075 [Planctomycetes bacterium]|nr:hypothetical protein [Planctomycetota bacterium]